MTKVTRSWTQFLLLAVASAVWTIPAYAADQIYSDQSPASAKAEVLFISTLVEDLEAELEQLPDGVIESEILLLKNQIQGQIDLLEANSDERQQWVSIQSQLQALLTDPLLSPKKKLATKLKSVGQFFERAGGVVVRGIGYTGASLDQVGSIPFRFVFKFFRGLFTGVAQREYAPLVFKDSLVTTNIAINFGPAIPALVFQYWINPASIPGSLVAFSFAVPVVVAVDMLSKFVCTTEAPTSTNPRLQRFCRNLGKVYRTGYKISGYGDRAGAAIHRLFRKKNATSTAR